MKISQDVGRKKSKFEIDFYCIFHLSVVFILEALVFTSYF